MCLLRSCNVSDSFAKVTGDQMALRRLVFAPSILIQKAETAVGWEENSVYNIHCRVQPSPTDEYVLLLNNFIRFNGVAIVGLREAGWTYRRIATHVGHNISLVCHCFQQWSVKHSHTCKPGIRRPRSTDARQDRRIMRAAVAARKASRDELRAHVATPVSPRTIGNRLLAAGIR